MPRRHFYPAAPSAKLLGIAVVVLILSVSGGIAYASSGTPGSGCGNSSKDTDCSTSVSIVWSSVSAPKPSAIYLKCTASISTPTLLTLRASNLAPGTNCNFLATLLNKGTVPATITDVIDPTSSCTSFDYTDDINLAHPQPVIGAGKTFLYQANLSLSSSAGNGCQDASSTFAVIITAAESVPLLTAPAISLSPASIYAGQSSTLKTVTSFSGGAPPYTCRWLEEAPGASGYSHLGSSFSCSAGSTPSTSTGALSGTGTWHFELQVTDSEPVTVTSNSVTVTVNPKPETYSVTFSESGLPSGVTWKVTVIGVPMSLCTNGGTDSLTWTGLASGTYSYSIDGNPGWHQSTLPYSGTVVVSGASVTEPTLHYVVETYTVTFSEYGLPSGDSWSITLNGVTMSSTGPSITFAEVNGTYSYKVGPVSGCGESSTSGTVTVHGADVSVSITFTKK
jgi:hypothetical protein